MTLVISLVRRAWRQLTSMRTALVLLFLLAVAAIPGSILPQTNVTQEKVTKYLTDHPTAGPLLARFGFFAVYSSSWFSAIYLLLFVSLVGCLVPRLRNHFVALYRVPPEAPKNLHRLPAHADGLRHGGDPAKAAEAVKGLLKARRFRVVLRENAGEYTVSAEKGFLKESGNLLFHFSLLALLVGVAFGSWYGWHGNRVLVAGPDHAFCDTLTEFDERGLGARVGEDDLPPFCVQLDDFKATYLASGQPRTFDAYVTVKDGGRTWQQDLRVNSPLRLDGANVYLLGHGYAPIVKYTDKYGKSQTDVAPFLPSDGMLTSDGVVQYPDANIDPKTGERSQIGFQGIYLPTLASDTTTTTSVYPAERNPRLMLQPYHGDLGYDAGAPLSVYALDQRQITAGRLTPFGPPLMMKVGETKTLPDGSTVQFLGTQQWASLSLRHDPGEPVMLAGAAALLIGLLGSLTGKRRRVFFRIDPDGMAAGGLPRSDYPGFQAEFDEIVRSAGAIVPAAREEPAPLVPVPDLKER